MTTISVQENSSKKPPITRNITDNGELISWIDNPLTYLRKCYAKYGDIFRIGSEESFITVLGGLKSNQLLGRESKSTLSSQNFWAETLTEMNCPHSFIGVDDDVHRFQRDLMRPMFAKSSFEGSISQFHNTLKSLLASQFEHQETQVSSFFRNTLSSQIGYALQGYSPTHEEVEALIEYQATAMNACSFKRISRKILQSQSYLKSKKTANELADRIIHSKPSNNDKTRYIDVLIKEGTENKPEWFTPGDIRNHAIIPFLAGIDTVGSALSFAIRELLLHPDLHRELKKEACQVFRREPDLSMIDELTKIDLFMKEILRLYPPAFALYRVATSDFDFEGYKITQGETLIFFITACHTDERYFPDPYEFNIQRFEKPDVVSGVYAPFGKGPHTCIGTGLSNIILPLNLATLLYYTDFDYEGDINQLSMDFTKPVLSLDPGFSITLKPSENYKQSAAS